MSPFDQSKQVASRIEGNIWKWNDWTLGAAFAGTYLGSHVWTNDSGAEVTAFDFANVTLGQRNPNGTFTEDKKPENEIWTFNQTAVLANMLAEIAPGQRIGFEFIGKGPRKGTKDGARLFNKFLDVNDVDQNWQRFLKNSPQVSEETVDVATAFGGTTVPPNPFPQAAVTTPPNPTNQVPPPPFGQASVPDVPFHSAAEYHSLIMNIAANKLGSANEEAAKVAVKAITSLTYEEKNYASIYDRLVKVLGA